MEETPRKIEQNTKKAVRWIEESSKDSSEKNQREHQKASQIIQEGFKEGFNQESKRTPYKTL